MSKCRPRFKLLKLYRNPFTKAYTIKIQTFVQDIQIFRIVFRNSVFFSRNSVIKKSSVIHHVINPKYVFRYFCTFHSKKPYVGETFIS